MRLQHFLDPGSGIGFRRHYFQVDLVTQTSEGSIQAENLSITAPALTFTQ